MNWKYGFNFFEILSPFPVFASSRYFSNPHPHFVTQKRRYTSEPIGSSRIHRGSMVIQPDSTMHRGSMVMPPDSTMHKGSMVMPQDSIVHRDSSIIPHRINIQVRISSQKRTRQ